MRKLLRHFRDRFYRGPAYLGIKIVGRRGYQSPTLTAMLWLFAWSVRVLTLPGRIILLCTGILVLYSMMGLRMPIYAPAALLTALILADMAVGFVVRPRVQAQRHLPRGVAAGAEARIGYTVTNPADKAAWAVEVDSFPLPPGIRLPRGVPYVETIAPGETLTVSGVLRAARRGQYTLPAVRCDSAFPFNLWRWGTITGCPERLCVFPRFTPLTWIDLPVGRSHHPSGIALSSSVADSMEFHGCRPYRDGDNPRHMHWRSWARAGYPVVKEFRQEYFPRTALILDTFCPRRLFESLRTGPQPPRFEAALSLAAAISDYLGRRDYVADLFAAGPDLYRFQSGRSLGHFDSIMEILACMNPHHGEPFEVLSAEIVGEIASLSSALVVLLRWNDARRELVETLTAAGVTVRCYLVTGDGMHPPGVPEPVRCLDAGAVLDGKYQSL